MVPAVYVNVPPIRTLPLSVIVPAELIVRFQTALFPDHVPVPSSTTLVVDPELIAKLAVRLPAILMVEPLIVACVVPSVKLPFTSSSFVSVTVPPLNVKWFQPMPCVASVHVPCKASVDPVVTTVPAVYVSVPVL
jgi:hypothetical protein